MQNQENIRAFVAVELTEDIRDVVWELQDQLQRHPSLQGLRWVDPFDFHITLKFLLDGAPVSQIPRIVETLDQVAEKFDPFSVTFGSLGTYPNVFRPSVIWLGIKEGENELKHLFHRVEGRLRELGLRAERRAYSPHLTLARVPKKWSQRQKRAAGDLIGPTPIPDFPPFTIDAVALIRSILTPQGPRYTRLSSSSFGEKL